MLICGTPDPFGASDDLAGALRLAEHRRRLNHGTDSIALFGLELHPEPGALPQRLAVGITTSIDAEGSNEQSAYAQF